MFDYIFYRLYTFYKKKEKNNSPVYTAALYLSIMQILLFFSIFMTINVLFQGKLLLKNLPIERSLLKILGVSLMISLNIFNYFLYKKKINKLILQFKNHSLNNSLKMWMLIFIGVGLFLIPFLLREMLKIIL